MERRTKRGLNTKKWLKDEIILLKKSDNKLSAREIKVELEEGDHRNSKEVKNLKESTIYYILDTNKDKWVFNDLDSRWTLGSCINSTIPIEAVKYIIPVQRYLKSTGRFLTRRRARWLSILSPTLIPLLEKMPEDVRILRLLQIASLYNRLEQLGEITDDVDTDGLDEVFIINQDVSNGAIAEQWIKIFRINAYLDTKNSQKQNPVAAEAVIIDKLHLEQKKLFKSFMKQILSLEDDRGLKDFMTFFRKNPEMQNAMLEWMVLNRRRDIAEKILGEKNNNEGEL